MSGENRLLASAGSILMGMAVIGYIDQFIRVIAETSSLWTFHALRTAMIWGLVAVFLLFLRRRMRVVNWRGLIARSAVISVAMMIYFGALGFLPVAQAAAGLFTAPIWVLIFSVTLFGLRVGKWRVAAVAMGFVGILLVLDIDWGAVEAVSFAPLAAGAFYAVGMISTREWCRDEGALEMSMGLFTAQGIWGLLGLMVMGGGDDYLTRGFVWPTPEVWFWIFVQAIGSLVAVVLLTRGYLLAEASYASVFEYSVLVFSAFFGFLVWGDVLSLWGWLGMALIAGAGSVIAFRGST